MLYTVFSAPRPPLDHPSAGPCAGHPGITIFCPTSRSAQGGLTGAASFDYIAANT